MVEKQISFEYIETISEVLERGNDKEDILTFLKTKNIFDSKVFNMEIIMNMLFNKKFYIQATDIFRERKFVSFNV